MGSFFSSFLAALGLLTVLPVGRGSPTPRELAGAVPFFPLVGCVVGVILLALDCIFAALPELVRGALLLGALAFITGALHLDGFADTCDGLAGTSPEQRLAIMADTRTGVYGAVGVTCLLLLKLTALASLGPPLRGPALIVAPVMGRWAMTLVITIFPYARGAAGLGYHFKQGARWPGFLAATLFTTAVVVVLVPWPFNAALTVVVPLVYATGLWMTRRLGGLTGDVYGATCEAVETFVLALLTAAPWRG